MAARPEQYVKLTPEMFIDYEFDLVSDKSVEQCWFGTKGIVGVSCGIKNGPVTAPVGRWKIEDGKTLLITVSNQIWFSHVFSTMTATNAVTTSGQWFVKKKWKPSDPVKTLKRQPKQ